MCLWLQFVTKFRLYLQILTFNTAYFIISISMAFISQNQRGYVTSFQSGYNWKEDNSLFNEIRNQGSLLIKTYGSILKWTWISLVGFWLIFPLILLIGYWLKLVSLVSHLEENSARDEQMNIIINQISFSGLATIFFTCLGIYNIWQFYRGIIFQEPVSSILIFAINSLIFGPTVWGYMVWNLFPKLIEILEDLNPYYFANQEIREESFFKASSKWIRIVIWIPILNWMTISNQKAQILKYFQILDQDWLF